jgi:Protoglobin
VAGNRDMVKELEVAHFQALLQGKLDQRYAESCRQTVEQEAALGLDARMRSTAGSYVLKAAFDALARKHRFSAARFAAQARSVSQAISFDVANAMTLHRQAAEQAVLARRSLIDSAIADFAGAIGDVIDAIKEASASLTATCSTLEGTADTTLARMASASSASAETTHRVDATVTATEELSGRAVLQCPQASARTLIFQGKARTLSLRVRCRAATSVFTSRVEPRVNHVPEGRKVKLSGGAKRQARPRSAGRANR